MKPLTKAAILGPLTAVLFLLLSWSFGYLGPAVLGITGYIGSLPASAFLRTLPDTVNAETRALIDLLIQSPVWFCIWYLILRKRRKRDDNDVA